ncbi:MAG: Rpn family recombination-promoting nuclease/putative transposase [Desulfobacterales bacterium]|nr:Rpn family recombination-promoting nuclease/putative transposase [Desulfobacterales bacterium]
MKHKIDPTVDCVFKAILGSEENKNLLINFLNAVIEPPKNERIIAVEILNPYSEKEFLSDKLSIVDIKAKDEQKMTFQIEIQVVPFSSLKSRMLYCWSDIYTSQLKQGHNYKELKPVISIWVVCETVFNNSNVFHHHFQAYDATNKIRLIDDFSIHVLELEKFINRDVKNDLERWALFFRDGKELDDEQLPDFMNTQEMRQAMNTLRMFSEKEREYHLYQSRLNYIREQQTIKSELEEAMQEKEAAMQEKKAAMQEKEAAMQEKEAAMQEKEAAMREKEEAMREKEEAMLEKEEAMREKEEERRQKEAALLNLESAFEREKKLREKLKKIGVNIED